MKKSSLLIIFLVVFIDLVGFGIVIPILPYYAQSFGASAFLLGLLMTSYSLMQFIMAPLWGRLSDYAGRRLILLTSLLGTGGSLLLLGFAKSLLWIFIGRLLAGLFAANISVAYAYISDVTTEQNRAKGMGIIGASFGLGFIFGPVIGGILSHYHGYSAPILLAAVLPFLNFCFAFLKLKEPELSLEARAANRGRKFDMSTLRSAFSDNRSAGGIGLFFLFTFAVTQMEVVFALFLKAKYGYDALHAGKFLAGVGLIIVLIQGGLIGRLSRRFGQLRLIIVGAASCCIGMAIFAGAPAVTLVLLALSLMAIGQALLHPSLSSLTSLGASADRRGGTMGIFHSAGSLARVLGPPAAGWLYDHVSAGSPLYSSSLISLLVCLIALVWGQRIQAAAPVSESAQSESALVL